MSKSLFLALLLVSPAVAFERRGLEEPSINQGAKIDPKTGTVASNPPLLASTPTSIEARSARVANDLVLFPPTLLGLTPPSRPRPLFASAPARREPRFFAPAKATDSLEVGRARDRLLLFRGVEPSGGAVGIGVAMFGIMTVLSAHAPRPFRILFDGPVHLGPAIFDGGGMGAALAGRGL